MPIRVLVVEDDDALRDILVETLEAEGFATQPASDGLSGLEIYRTQGPFDVILLDEYMPGLKGRELLALLRDEGWPVKAVLMSGSVAFDEETGSSLGIRVWLRKPVPMEDITAAIRQAAGGE